MLSLPEAIAVEIRLLSRMCALEGACEGAMNDELAEVWIAGSECARVGFAREILKGGEVGRKTSSWTSRLNRNCFVEVTESGLAVRALFRRLGWLADLGKEARR